jgi:hypothetical protein
MKKLLLVLLLLSWVHPICAGNESHRRWALQAGIGGITMHDETPDGAALYFNDDQGNLLYLSGDYYLTQRLALTGQLFLEQNGMLTDLSDGIGYKKFYMSGIQSGAKYYFFPKKWIFQPHIGMALQVNVLNLGTTKGSRYGVAEEGYPGSQFRMDYDVQCPMLSAVPQIGCDLHLFSTVSLCFDIDARLGLWGHNRYRVLFIDGPQMGKNVPHRNGMTRTSASIGLKIDLPTKKISQRAWNNLFLLFSSWLESKSTR